MSEDYQKMIDSSLAHESLRLRRERDEARDLARKQLAMLVEFEPHLGFDGMLAEWPWLYQDQGAEQAGEEQEMGKASDHRRITFVPVEDRTMECGLCRAVVTATGVGDHHSWHLRHDQVAEPAAADGTESEPELEQLRLRHQARRVPALVRQNFELRAEVERLTDKLADERLSYSHVQAWLQSYGDAYGGESAPTSAVTAALYADDESEQAVSDEMRAALDAHYAEHPEARPSLQQVARALAEQEVQVAEQAHSDVDGTGRSITDA